MAEQSLLFVRKKLARLEKERLERLEAEIAERMDRLARIEELKPPAEKQHAFSQFFNISKN